MSWNGPPPMLISRTPPSNPLSALQALLKLNCAGEPFMGMVWVRSSVTPGVDRSGAKAAFGALNGFVVEVTQAGSEPDPVDDQPTGKSGVATPSKFSDNGVPGVAAPRRKL